MVWEAVPTKSKGWAGEGNLIKIRLRHNFWSNEMGWVKIAT